MATVIDKMTEQCRMAFQSKQPLILIDTEERELINELALKCELVDLWIKTKNYGQEEKPYYEYIGTSSEPAVVPKPQISVSVDDSPEALKKIAEENDEDSVELYSLAKSEEDEVFVYSSEPLHRPKVTYDMDECINLYTDPKKLQEFARTEGKLDSERFPSMFIFHLNKDAADKDAADTILHLRYYVDKYLKCGDNQASLRNSCVLLYGDASLLPKDLMPYAELVTVDYPDQAEIIGVIKDMTAQIKLKGKVEENAEENPEALKILARELAGFSLMDVKRILRRLLWTDYVDDMPLLYDADKRKKTILEFKEQALLKSGGLLELQKEADDDEKDNELGGMGEYIEWIEAIKNDVLHSAETACAKGTPPPKGVLLCGVPGCGKSEAAKILHKKWNEKDRNGNADNIPMLKMDMDRLMASHVGESEKHMREALKQAEAMAPCILWIDELDKAFSGAAASGNSDSGTFKRMFGRLLSWMQDNKKACFIFATANDISQLPPEFFRNGRFDARYAVFMPTHDECIEIFREHMRRAEKLRKDTSAAYGNENIKSLFGDGKDSCMEETCLKEVMAIFTENVDDFEKSAGVKFVSGADIRLIVNTALSKMKENEELPLKTDRWKQLVKEAIESPAVCTQGDSNVGLDQITECYIRLLRGPFVPASKQALFQKAYYITADNNGKTEGSYNPPTKSFEEEYKDYKDYDKALYHAIQQRIQRVSRRVENEA